MSYPAARRRSSAACTTAAKNQRLTYGATTPTAIVCPLARLAALGEAT
jgi:hypothetical protein